VDLSFLNKKNYSVNFTKRSFELLAFKVNIKTINLFFLRFFSILSSIFLKFGFNSTYFFFNKYYERNLSFDPSLAFLKGNLYLNGYFQSEKYFINYRSDLLNLLSFKIPLEDENSRFSNFICQNNSVSNHVRRGDYVSIKEVSEFHGVLPLS